MRPRVDVQDASDALDLTAGQVPLDGQDGAQVAFAGKESVHQSSPLANTPAGSPSQLPRLLAGAPGPRSQPPAHEVASLSFAHCAPGARPPYVLECEPGARPPPALAPVFLLECPSACS